MDIPALQTALTKLDPTNDNHWTADGQPRLDTVKMLAANPAINREQVEAAAPGYLRTNAASYTMQPPSAAAVPAAPATPEPVPPAAPAAVLQPVAPAQPVDSGVDENAATFSADQSKPAEVVGGGADAEDGEPTLEAQLAEASEKSQKIRAALDYLNKELAAAMQVEDGLRKQLEVDPRTANVNAIRGYLDAQAKVREDRIARKIALNGVDLKELTRGLKAPIDAAMARKTGRGGQRPNMNAK